MKILLVLFLMFLEISSEAQQWSRLYLSTHDSSSFVFGLTLRNHISKIPTRDFSLEDELSIQYINPSLSMDMGVKLWSSRGNAYGIAVGLGTYFHIDHVATSSKLVFMSKHVLLGVKYGIHARIDKKGTYHTRRGAYSKENAFGLITEVSNQYISLKGEVDFSSLAAYYELHGVCNTVVKSNVWAGFRAESFLGFGPVLEWHSSKKTTKISFSWLFVTKYDRENYQSRNGYLIMLHRYL